MADELVSRVSVAYNKSGQSITQAIRDFYLTIAGSGASAPTVSVGTSEEDYSFGDVGTPGFLWLRNIDPTHFVTWGPKDTTMKAAGILLPITTVAKPPPPTILYLATGVVIRWKADTAACLVETILIPA